MSVRRSSGVSALTSFTNAAWLATWLELRWLRSVSRAVVRAAASKGSAAITSRISRWALRICLTLGMTVRMCAPTKGRSSARLASSKLGNMRMNPTVGSRPRRGGPWLARPAKKPIRAMLIATDSTRLRMSHLLERIINLLVGVKKCQHADLIEIAVGQDFDVAGEPDREAQCQHASGR